MRNLLCGDPIEMSALKTVLGKDRSDNNPLVMGAAKANIGHLEEAAGIAGLIKAVLVLQHELSCACNNAYRLVLHGAGLSRPVPCSTAQNPPPPPALRLMSAVPLPPPLQHKSMRCLL